MPSKRSHPDPESNAESQRNVRQRDMKKEEPPVCSCYSASCHSWVSMNDDEREEYEAENREYLLDLEASSAPEYSTMMSLTRAGKIDWKRRNEMVDVILLLASRKRMGHVPLHLAINYLDCILAKVEVKGHFFLLTALACLSLAAKVHRDDWPLPQTKEQLKDPRFHPIFTTLVDFNNLNMKRYGSIPCDERLLMVMEIKVMGKLEWKTKHTTSAETQAVILDPRPQMRLVRKQYADFFGVCALFSLKLLTRYNARDRANGAVLLASEVMRIPLELCDGSKDGARRYADALLVELSKGLHQRSEVLNVTHEDAFIMLIDHGILNLYIKSQIPKTPLKEVTPKRKIQPEPKRVQSFGLLDDFIRREVAEYWARPVTMPMPKPTPEVIDYRPRWDLPKPRPWPGMGRVDLTHREWIPLR
ncbi:hypothetical protein OE88DRAFT_1751740 [Heliocybe sulcata]|uniref:Cyclin N-terminal domain-containing protein n=1 Tax=Heliocybe sulcata TaxID=5364 RepID=A0A5C3MZD7_9AGAM|nr:hypothetical protein OE88DRAFT_1751740 [Heliocybe sulcata]